MKLEKNRVLVIAAHPDDEVLGCGGTMVRHSAKGDEVWVLILGGGIMARNDGSDKEKKDSLVMLHKSAEEANKMLNVKKLIIKDFPDNKFDSVPLLDIVQSIESVIREFKPNIIYTHHCADVNIDHRMVSEAVESAVRPMENSFVNVVLAFEVPSSTEWNFTKSNLFRPNVFVNVEDFVDKKIKALQNYNSEMREFPHPRSIEYISSLIKIRGGQSGMRAAESFCLIFERRK